MSQFIRLINTFRSTAKWVILGVVVAFLIYAGLNLWPESSTPEKVGRRGADSMWVAPSPIDLFDGNTGSLTDTSGQSQTYETDPDKESLGSLQIQTEDTASSDNKDADEETLQIALETDRNQWLPDFTKRDPPVRTLNRSKYETVYTPPTTSIVEWSPRPSVGIGMVSMTPSLVVGISPLRIGPVRIGSYVAVPTRNAGRTSAFFDVSTRILEHLEAGIGVTHRSNLSFSVRYRF